MYPVEAYQLMSNCGNLRLAARSLDVVWNDSQYDNFLINYIEPVEDELSTTLRSIELLLIQFNSLTTIIENLESS